MRKYILPGAGLLVAGFVIYLLAMGSLSKVAGLNYTNPGIDPSTDSAKASILAEGLVEPLDQEMKSLFGWTVNDLFFVPAIIDNKANYERGIIYATRSASECLARRVARYGDTDTIPQVLVDATAKHFAYAENVWGWWSLYNTEKHFKNGIKAWRSWAKDVGNEKAKKPMIFNMTTNDVVEILKWASSTMDYCLGVLNDDSVGHFRSDDVVYYVKGVTRVVQGVFEAINVIDGSIVTRGGKENVAACHNRMRMIATFNPVYVVAGSYGVGDNFWPNHIAALARHVDVLSNRLNDVRRAMER